MLNDWSQINRILNHKMQNVIILYKISTQPAKRSLVKRVFHNKHNFYRLTLTRCSQKNVQSTLYHSLQHQKNWTLENIFIPKGILYFNFSAFHGFGVRKSLECNLSKLAYSWWWLAKVFLRDLCCALWGEKPQKF